MNCVKLASQAAFDLPLLFQHRQGDLQGPIPRNENHSKHEKQKGEQQKPESPIVVFTALICSGNAQGKEKPKGNCCTHSLLFFYGVPKFAELCFSHILAASYRTASKKTKRPPMTPPSVPYPSLPKQPATHSRWRGNIAPSNYSFVVCSEPPCFIFIPVCLIIAC